MESFSNYLNQVGGKKNNKSKKKNLKKKNKNTKIKKKGGRNQVLIPNANRRLRASQLRINLTLIKKELPNAHNQLIEYFRNLELEEFGLYFNVIEVNDDFVELEIINRNRINFFRNLITDINAPFDEELVKLGIDDIKLNYSFNAWINEQSNDQRRSPSLSLETKG